MKDQDQVKITKLVFVESDPMWEEKAQELRMKNAVKINIGSFDPIEDEVIIPEIVAGHIKNKDYTLGKISKTDLAALGPKIPFIIEPADVIIPLYEKTQFSANGRAYDTYTHVASIPLPQRFKNINVGGMVGLALDHLERNGISYQPDKGVRHFAMRAIDNHLVSFDLVRDPSMNEGEIPDMTFDSLSQLAEHQNHKNMNWWNDIHVGDPFRITYPVLGGHFGTLGELYDAWGNKNDPGHEVGARAKKVNVKKARDSVSGKTAAGALFKSLLGSKK